MAAYCAANGVILFPHGKTTMAPQILAAPLDGGAAGITAASISQVRMFRRFGVRNVLLANEFVDDASISWVARELTADGQFSFLCYVDSVTGAGRLDDILAAYGFTGRLRVLVELGHDDGRTGCRTRAERSPWRPRSAGRRDSSWRVWRLRGLPARSYTRRDRAEGPGVLRGTPAAGPVPGRFGTVPGATGGDRRRLRLLRRGRQCAGPEPGLEPDPAQRVLRHPRPRAVQPHRARRTARTGRPVLEPALEAWAPVLSGPSAKPRCWESAAGTSRSTPGTR